MLITRQIEIDAGHRVPSHKGKCRNLHGHRYRIELGVTGPKVQDSGASDEGMVIDYGDLKDILKLVIEDGFDHGFILYERDELWADFLDYQKDGMKIIFVPFIPTAENLAQHWGILIKKVLPSNLKLKYVKVWETPNSTALYEN